MINTTGGKKSVYDERAMRLADCARVTCISRPMRAAMSAVSAIRSQRAGEWKVVKLQQLHNRVRGREPDAHHRRRTQPAPPNCSIYSSKLQPTRVILSVMSSTRVPIRMARGISSRSGRSRCSATTTSVCKLAKRGELRLPKQPSLAEDAAAHHRG